MVRLSIKAEDLNMIVYRYLVENGYEHTAYAFRYESHLPNYLLTNQARGKSYPKYPPQCLIGLIYKAILYLWVEAHTDPTTGEEVPCDQPFSLFKPHVCSEGSNKIVPGEGIDDELSTSNQTSQVTSSPTLNKRSVSPATRSPKKDDSETSVPKRRAKKEVARNKLEAKTETKTQVSKSKKLFSDAPPKSLFDDAPVKPFRRLKSKAGEVSTDDVLTEILDEYIPGAGGQRKRANSVSPESARGGSKERRKNPPSEAAETPKSSASFVSPDHDGYEDEEEEYSDDDDEDDEQNDMDEEEIPRKGRVVPKSKVKAKAAAARGRGRGGKVVMTAAAKNRPERRVSITRTDIEILRTFPDGHQIGFQVHDREVLFVQRKAKDGTWRVHTVLKADDDSHTAKDVNHNMDGSLMAIYWGPSDTKIGRVHLYEISSNGEDITRASLDPDPARVTGVVTMRFSQRRKAFRIVFTNGKPAMTWGKQNGVWKLEEKGDALSGTEHSARLPT